MVVFAGLDPQFLLDKHLVLQLLFDEHFILQLLSGLPLKAHTFQALEELLAHELQFHVVSMFSNSLEVRVAPSVTSAQRHHRNEYSGSALASSPSSRQASRCRLQPLSHASPDVVECLTVVVPLESVMILLELCLLSSSSSCHKPITGNYFL